MWTRAEIEAPGLALRAVDLSRLPEPWATKWWSLDDDAETTRVLGELRVSLADWTRAMTKLPAGARLAGVSFLYSSGEGPPSFPQDVWADGLSEVKRDGADIRPGARAFSGHAAFALCVVAEWLSELSDDRARRDSPVGVALARALVLRSLVWLQAALPRLRTTPDFAALPITADFVFLASPGPDAPWGIVG